MSTIQLPAQLWKSTRLRDVVVTRYLIDDSYRGFGIPSPVYFTEARAVARLSTGRECFDLSAAQKPGFFRKAGLRRASFPSRLVIGCLRRQPPGIKFPSDRREFRLNLVLHTRISLFLPIGICLIGMFAMTLPNSMVMTICESFLIRLSITSMTTYAACCACKSVFRSRRIFDGRESCGASEPLFCQPLAGSLPRPS